MIYSQDKLQIYPRGFLGRPLPASVLKKETPFFVERRRKQFSLSLLDSPSKVRIGDEKIDHLFNQYIRAEGSINSFKFREKIFKAAIDLFAGRDFYFWYHAQKASPLYGDYQKRFLEDTVRYLSIGTRELSPVNWDALLTNSTNNEPNENEGDSEFVNQFFGESTLGRGQRLPKNRDIVDILQLWWGKPAGAGDLLYTLHILFGDIH